MGTHTFSDLGRNPGKGVRPNFSLAWENTEFDADA
jgi:hypothetical protein